MSLLLVVLKRFTRETFISFQVRNYRLYYFGQVISTSGTFMQSIAQAWLVLKISNSGTALGIISALQYIPILLFGTLGGFAALAAALLGSINLRNPRSINTNSIN